MAILTHAQANQLKEIILNYLQGEDISVIRVRLQVACAEFKIGCRDIYRSIELESAEEDPFVIAILGSLNIKKNNILTEPGEYEKLLKKSENLHHLLIHLYHDGHHHVACLLRLIENTKPKRNWTLTFLLGATLSAGLGAFFHFQKQYLEAIANWLTRTFPFIINWLGKTFTLLRNMPLLGIIYNSLSLGWSWYHTFSNGTTTIKHKLSSLFFKTLTAGLTIGAYFLSYMASGTMILPAAMLFVLSSSVDLFKSLYIWYKNHKGLKSLTLPGSEEQNWETLAEYERAKNIHQYSLQSVWLKLTAAVLTTTAVFIWSFFPPSLVLTVCCMIFITLISLTKKTILSGIHETYANRLQQSLRHIDATLKPEYSLSHQHSWQKLNQMLSTLEAKERELNLRETDLNRQKRDVEIRSQAVIETLEAIRTGGSLDRVLESLQALQARSIFRHPTDEVFVRDRGAANIDDMDMAEHGSQISTP